MQWQTEATGPRPYTLDAGTRRVRRYLAACALVLGLLVAAICALALWRSWEATLDHADDEARNLANLIDRHVSSVLERASVALGTTAAQLERERQARGFARQGPWSLADSGAAQVPEISQIGVFDAGGQQVCGDSSARCQHLDVADQDYFVQLRQRPERVVRLFGPHRSRVDERDSLVLARALLESNGAFAGVVIALIPLAQFEPLLAVLDLGRDGVVALRGSELGLLLRQPKAPAGVASASVATLADAVRQAPAEGAFRGVSALDGIDRLNRYRRLRDFPVYVVVGLATHEFLAGWRMQAWGTLAFLVLYAASSVAISRLLLSTMHDRHRIQELYDHAPCAYCSLDTQGVFRRANATMLGWLGCTREQLIGRCALPDFLNPEGRASFEHHFPAFLRTGRLEGLEFDLQGRHGQVRRVVVSASALHDAHGRFVLSNSVMYDITELHAARGELKRFVDQLEDRVKQRTRQLRQLAGELDAAEDRERQQLARDLHDDLGQTLAAARIHLAALQPRLDGEGRDAAQRIDELIARANQSTRSLAAQLAPPALYELGLTAALEWLAEDIGRNFGLQVTVVDDGQPKPLSRESRSILYRATRELLVNSAKHAHADVAEVEIERCDHDIVVRVSDSGIGFDAAVLTAARGQGMGLLSVRERLSFIGGSVDIRSLPGDGAVITLQAPLADEAHALEA
ncbi:MAG: PAS domain-containing protein [Burkholderiales bacterium]|nr:PAS domain-containing protein [Burkholderiales bacterium]